MQIVILAGGLGTRLRPLTDNLPKPMIKIDNRPFLEILINFLKKNGLTKFILCTGHHSNIIENYFGRGEKFGIDIQYSQERQPLGTAGAIKNASKKLDDEFIVINGDTFVKLDYDEFFNYSKNKKRQCVVAGYKISNKNREGNLLVDNKLNVISYHKNDKSNQMNYVDAGVYFFKKEVFFSTPEKSSIEYDLLPNLASNNKVSLYPCKDDFFDIGTFENIELFRRFYEKNQQFLE